MSGSSSKMSVTQLTLLTALNMMGSGIIMLPTKLAEVGTFSIVSWLVTAGGSTALAYAFAKCGMLSRNRGGMGGYAEYAFGKSGSFLANYAYCVSLLIANIAIAISAVGYAVALFGLKTTPFETCLLTIVVLWICTVLNFKGAKITGLISNFTAWGVIIPVAGISVIGWFWFNPETYISAWNPHDLPTFDAISASISMTLWSFLGLESACANSESVDNPEKNVPKAVLGATIGVAVIYILSTNVAAGIVDNAELVKSTAPFGLVFATMFNGTVGQIVMGLMILSCPRLGSSGVRFRSMRHAVKKNGRIGRLCRVCVWRTRRFSRQLFLCNLARLRQHCHFSGCSELRSELVPSAIFFSICLYRLRTPFMDRIASHLPLALHHGPHYRHLRLGSPTALDYACYCRRLLV